MLRARIPVALPILVCHLALLPSTMRAEVPEKDFTVIILPDTQNYAAKNPAIFTAQTQWIVNNAPNLNIQFVLHEGDIVDSGRDATQWANADASMRVLDGKVPYAAVIGNHDYDTNDISLRTPYTTNFNANFGPQRYATSPWYRASYAAGSNEDFYSVFTVGDRQFLVLALEVYPRDAVLDWANSIVAANPDKEVIVLTHSYMFADNTRVGRCDQGGKSDLKVPADNDGDGMWDKLISRYSNISLVLSGHIVWNGGIGRRADLGVNGNLVNQVLADFQNYANGGNGYLRILTFRPSANSIDVATYSPWLDQSLTDARNQFTLKWHGDATMAGQPSIVDGRVRSDLDCAFVSTATVTADDTSATTDLNAIFSLSTMAQTSTLAASATGWLTRQLQVAAPSGAGAQAEFFLTPAGRMMGTVTDAGGAVIGGASVQAKGGYAGTSISLSTDANGSFDSDWISAGSYTVNVTAPQGSSTFAALVSGGQTTAVKIVLNGTSQPPYLSGIISSAIDGKPLASATVTAGGLSTTSNTSGAYAFSTLSAATYTVTAAKSGWGSQSTTATLVNGTSSTANIKLATSGKITGTVKREDGTAAGGIKVTFTGGVIANTTSVVSGSTGTFSSSWIPVGNYTVSASDTNQTASSSATVSAGATATVSLTFAASIPPGDTLASVSGRVISAIDGKVLSGTTVTIGTQTGTSDATGRYRFSSLQPAMYSICATKSGWGKQCVSTSLLAGPNSAPDIRLATSGRISGKVTNTAGTNVSGAMVTFTGGVINNTTSVSTSSTGTYSSTWIPVGDYSVSVSKAGVTSSGTAKVTAGGNFILNLTI